MNALKTERISLPFSQEHLMWLNAHSDHPIGGGFIFSRVFQSHDGLASFLRELSAVLSGIDGSMRQWLARYDDAWFAGHTLIMMFSHERSGSNRLQLRETRISGSRADLLISRTRGLTMDMAYLFLFHELRGHDVTVSSARIEEERSVEAILF